MPLRKISQLKNLGTKSEQWLNAVGIYTHEELAKLGAVEAYLRVKQAGYNPSLNLLYAMEAALQDIHWTQLSHKDKTSLIMAIDACLDLQRK